MMSNALCDDYGFWSDYSQYSNDYRWMYTHVMTEAEVAALGLPAGYAGKTTFQNRLPAAELKILSGNETGTKPYTAGYSLGKGGCRRPVSPPGVGPAHLRQW